MKKQKRMKIRTGARTASKVQEKELISKAKKIRKNPDLILPKCEHEGRCAFDKIRRQIRRVQIFADDEKKLTKLSKSGDQLARAYAATLLLAHQEKAPYLAVFKTPFGEIAYAMRGKVKKEKLIGVQHYDKPKWKLLSVMDLAKKKGLHIYSTKKGMVCMGREAKPPDYFVKEMMDTLKYDLNKENNIYSCEHISKKDVEKKITSSKPYLLLNWKSPGKKVAICSKCASKKSNILASINQNLAIPDLEKDFEIDVITGLKCETECDKCEVEKQINVDEEVKNTYSNGGLSDQGLMEKHMEKFQDFLKSGDKKVYIIDDNCYGNDMDTFISALNPTDYERQGLSVILKKIKKPVVVSKATPNKVLNMFWSEYGAEAINEIIGDEETAKELFNKTDTSKTSPSQILREASILTKERDIISALPDYESLPSLAKFADNIARIYMTQGKDDALRAIEHYKGGDTKIKSVAYAFLLALDQGASKKWQYTKTEIDFAQFLKNPASKLLNSDPENYHDNLQDLLSATGSTQKLTKGR
ncbi:MAG: hypothetical protein A7315_04800 [Candidatus Altiarchaeales archaeon WOR_SM1_79]|nr:MAG: hypothetical protein A7315_04800 [Candidatus Altiarchaeales archaeon WOR_SM1_79]